MPPMCSWDWFSCEKLAGCATSFLEALMKFERMLRGFLVFEMPEVLRDPLPAKSRSIKRPCEDSSASKCISLRNPWVNGIK